MKSKQVQIVLIDSCQKGTMGNWNRRPIFFFSNQFNFMLFRTVQFFSLQDDFPASRMRRIIEWIAIYV